MRLRRPKQKSSALTCRKSISLGTGELSVDWKGVCGFWPTSKTSEAPTVVFKRALSSFLRVTDLEVTDTESSASEVPNYHHAASDPPPGIDAIATEKWVALDDGDGQHAPVAPFAVQALVQSATALTHNRDLWTPDSKTQKILSKEPDAYQTWQVGVDHVVTSDQVLVWSGTITPSGLYGSELPAVRAAGRVPIAADVLAEMLIDSTRVHEYNQMSLGRTDLLVLQDTEDGPFGGRTKIMQSKSQFLRKTLQFTSLLHARRLEGGSHLIVTRAVQGASAGAVVSEILLGVNVIHPLNDGQCLIVTVNHIRSPMVPMMIAKRIGLQAAVNFIADLRNAKVRS